MKPIAFLAVLLYCTSLLAAPAAWYKWQSAESSFDICSQISPGDGWVIIKGPFVDAVCKKLGVPR